VKDRLAAAEAEKASVEGELATVAAEIEQLREHALSLDAVAATYSDFPAILDALRLQGDQYGVKRLIGMPGDTLAMEGGVLYRNGLRVDEPYAVHADPTRSEDPMQRAKMRQWQVPHLAGRDTASYQPDLQDWGPIVVPADSFFMMGDNRDSSYDGRYWGFLPRQNVRGRPLVVYFSYDPSSWRSLPFLTAVRWGRIFTTPQ
jgi:signal peptidase I